MKSIGWLCYKDKSFKLDTDMINYSALVRKCTIPAI